TFRTPYASACLQKDISKTSDFYRCIPLFAALVFVSHPVQTQAVTYIAQRAASLATLFYLGCLVMYIKARGSETSKKAGYAFYAAAILSAVLAMRTKEITFTLPVMVLLYEFMFLRGDIRKRVLYLLPLLLTMLIIPLSMMITKGASMGAGSAGIDELTKMAGIADVSRWDYLNTQFRVIVTYIRLLFLPIHQNLDYNYPVYRTFFTAPIVLSFLFLLGIFCGGVYLLYRSFRSDQADRFWWRLIAFGIFWFFVTLSVESSIIPIVDVIFEHRLYLPSVGFVVAILSVIALVQVRLAAPTKGVAKVFILVMILAVISLSVTAYARNMVWRDAVTFWEDVVKKSPYKPRPHFYLGVAYHEQGRFDDAIREFLATINLKPDYAWSYRNLGIAYHKKGHFDDAIKAFQKTIELMPDHADTYYNLGEAYHKQRRFDDAIRQYQTAMKLDSTLVAPHVNLGEVYHQQGRFDDAIRESQAAIKLKPDHARAYSNLGAAYHQQGRLDDAIREYQTSINLKPDYADAHYNLGLAYQKQGRLDDAIKAYQTATKLNPNLVSPLQHRDGSSNGRSP
ncbi:MAG: tetratricopeptide repeat protein, partial [Deltaproteobacteria bacterium]|nr:tetratricopeptide repeat protein [Deltaproteobacteria bacterium]